MTQECLKKSESKFTRKNIYKIWLFVRDLAFFSFILCGPNSVKEGEKIRERTVHFVIYPFLQTNCHMSPS